jgi:hypothetical protein
MHDDDRSPLGVQLAKDAIEKLAVGDHRRDVVDRRTIERGQLDLDRAAPAAACDIDA